jgi:DNA-binding beta-propeller fold protein YncE
MTATKVDGILQTKWRADVNHKATENRKSTAAILLVILIVTGAIVLAGFAGVTSKAPGASGYQVVKTIPICGEGGWDYVLVDPDARRVYVSHATHVVVLDADSGAKVGDIPDTQGVHGVALAPELGRGYVSNGRANTVTVFELKDLKTIATVSTGGQNPDAIYYDAATKRVFAFNGHSSNATAINAADGTVAGMIPVDGKPEFAAGAGDGHVFVNVEDKSEMLEIDVQKLTVLHRWPLAPCQEPSGLAMDAKNRRLFAVCDNKMMAVVNADTGKVVATPAIGDGPDAAGFDPGTQLAFSSNGGSGTLTVIHEDSPDTKTHTIYLPIAEFGDTAAPGERRPPMKPDTFGLLVVSR